MKTPPDNLVNESSRTLRRRIRWLKRRIQAYETGRAYYAAGFAAYEWRGQYHRIRGSYWPRMYHSTRLRELERWLKRLNYRLEFCKDHKRALRRRKQRSRPRVKHDRRFNQT
jgi:hypothetical protein